MTLKRDWQTREIPTNLLKTIENLSVSELHRFTDLWSSAQQENAYMDGECSITEGNRRYNKAIKNLQLYIVRIGIKGSYEEDLDTHILVSDLVGIAYETLENKNNHGG